MLGNYIIPVATVAGIGLIAAIILSVASKFLAVKVDERVSKVRDVLPGANCGSCGYAGCDDYAAKVVSGEAEPNLCTPGGSSTASAIGEALGIEVGEVEAKCAFVRCRGHLKTTNYIMDYKGPQTCAASNALYQGRRSCSYGCLGFGDCIKVCSRNAISVVDGVAVVDEALCEGCGLCAKACPDGIITIIPKSSKVRVACMSKDKGAFTRKLCINGCIGCKKCEKTCEHGAITVVDNNAVIDFEKCTSCGNCVAACPVKAIVMAD